MREGNSISFSRSPWWTDCINQVELWICQDRTTTRDNLHDKAMSYAKNYLCTIPELPSADKDSVVKEIADKVELDLEILFHPTADESNIRGINKLRS